MSHAIARTDLLVVDARAPRFNQAVVALGALTAVTTGAWLILALLGVQLAVSVVFGRQYCLPCVFYFRVVQPRLGEGPLEDARAPRFANVIGAVFLLSSSLAWAAGFPLVGRVLGGVVAALASLAVASGICVGCEVYKVLARLRGIRGGAIARVDLEQLGVTQARNHIVFFTHPLCSDCQTLGAELDSGATPVVRVDVSKRRDLAKKYGISLVPTAVAVTADGVVTGQIS